MAKFVHKTSKDKLATLLIQLLKVFWTEKPVIGEYGNEDTEDADDEDEDEAEDEG